MALYWKDGVFSEHHHLLVESWRLANNPKADGLVTVPVQPLYNPLTQNCTFDGSDWVVTAKSAKEIAAITARRRSSLVCSPRQARLALAQSNLLDAVDAFVQAGDAALKIEWEYATEIRRDWPPVAAFAEANAIDDATIDGMFELAMTL